MLIAQTTILLAPHSSSSHIQWGGDDTPLHASRPWNVMLVVEERPKPLEDLVMESQGWKSLETAKLDDSKISHQTTASVGVGFSGVRSTQ
jgi:hypothetical protein